MRRLDDTPIDPEIEACLDAIDATLAGEPVDPRHAELAELALLLADERPRPSAAFAAEMDARVARRFAAAPAPASSRGGGWTRPQRMFWSLGVAGGFVAALVVVVVVIGSLGSGTSSMSSSSLPTLGPVHGASAGAASTSSSGSGGSSSGSASASSAASSGESGNLDASPSSTATRSVAPPANGRKVVQSAELDLSAAPNRVDSVAQEVFNVVGTAGGIVDSSQVTQTGGLDGSASFQLRLPSASLGQTMSRLSDLPGARVVSRTDNSTDVNATYLSTQHALADAQTLRKALLGRLAAATTTTEIDSLKQQLSDAESKISAEQAALRGLNSKINYSRVTLVINAGQTAAPVHHSSGGFTIGHAAHVASRVLVVAAGVGLIALAVLVPLALVAALLAWAAYSLRRRRREHALDVA
jgi:hypothetical protein